MLHTTRLIRTAVALTLLVTTAAANAAVTCATIATLVPFGVYNPLTAGALDTTGTVSVTCSITYPPLVDTVNYTVDLSAGSSGSLLTRRMQFGANSLNYNLYTTGSYVQVWGDGSGSTADVSGSMTIGFIFWPSSRTNTHTVFGRLPASQDVAAGNYSDTIIVAVTY